MIKNKIRVIGAKEHNLKNINVEIPKNTLTVITGPSGSGKTSLALDTIYSEGRRRYVESLSAYARQFLGVSKRPDVEKIDGLCPAVAIDQKTVSSNPRSTVGTVTEIYDYLRVLFARVGTPHCPECKTEIKEESAQNITHMLVEHFNSEIITIAAPIANDKKGEFKNELKDLFEKGFYRFVIDGKIYKFKKPEDIDNVKLQKQYKHTIDVLIDKIEINQEDLPRVQESIDRAFSITNGLCKIIDSKEKEHLYSSSRICLKCARSFPELEPRFFSFNSPVGACSDCHGLGFVQEWSNTTFFIGKYSKEIACRSCLGKRLKPEALAVTIGEKNIYDVANLSVEKSLTFFKTLKLNEQKKEIAASILKEIINRLTFLYNVGLSYLTIARQSRTLSGGESQRIRLATQIGSALSGVVYVLDEPSIGLHQRDNNRLIETLKLLRDQGNTVLVVEHDIDTMKAADYVIDMGPGSGRLGGQITAIGTPKEIEKNPDSLTGGYMSGRKRIEMPEIRRLPKGSIKIKGAYTNNLKNVDVQFPLGILCAVSGVSGSGKSSLVTQTLAPYLQQYCNKGYKIHGNFESIEGVEQIDNVVLVNQKPIGRTPRSNPATYLGIFNDIRSLFASLPESNARGYAMGQFSFNVKQGRCFECNGDGVIKVPMHFLEDVSLICKSCKGKRYNQQTLEITYKRKNISDVLDLSARDALEFFDAFPRIKKRLQLLCDVGLEYIKLGQPSTTLSGGEAQRIKLVDELAKRGNKTFYILDEPTTGLHSCDVDKLLQVLNRLVDRGNTVLIIEHNLDVLKNSDYIIDVGPEGGDAGGSIVATGTPQKVSLSKKSFTGKYLKRIFSK
jgi:excinuclease ABC subunit A